MLLVVSKIKQMAKACDLRTSKEFLVAVSERVEAMVIASAEVAAEAGMNTIMARHLPEEVGEETEPEEEPEGEEEPEEE